MIAQFGRAALEYWDSVESYDIGAERLEVLVKRAQRDIRLLVRLMEAQDDLIAVALEYLQKGNDHGTGPHDDEVQDRRDSRD